ncbi:hypothetical protein [Roseovarius salis]|uniref:hypothetical protein n=1 Tax=Roseovarius salis TaxID=3376063 RepID=UPI0037CAD3B5
MTATDLSQPDTQHAKAPSSRGEALLAAKILLTVLVVLAGWATSVMTWGIPGLYIPALAAVPVMWAVLLLIVRG